MSEMQINTYANQLKTKWTNEKNQVVRKPSSPGTPFLRTMLRQRREQQRQMQETIASSLDAVATAS